MPSIMAESYYVGGFQASHVCRCLLNGGIHAGPLCNNSCQDEGQAIRWFCSGLMKPDTLLAENARQIEVSDDQATSYL